MPSRKCVAHFVGHQELLVLRPAVGRLRQADFVLAQRRAVGLVAVGLVRRAEADHAADDDQRGPVVGLLERLDRAAQRRPGR